MKETVWNSIAEYNTATWPWQTAFILAAYALVAIQCFRPSSWSRAAIKIYMTAVSLWIAFVYYMGFASGRDYSNIMTIFWCMMALSWIYDIVTRFSSFERSGRFTTVSGLVILALPFAYPFISISRGLEFPGITTPLLPSSVALFMLGTLMTFSRKINFFAFIFILHWSIIAISKIGIFGMPEDALLAAACIPSMAIFFIRSMRTLPEVSKPSAKTVGLLIISVSLLLTASLVMA